MTSSFGIQPLQDRIIVKRNDPDQVTASGLIIPPNAQKSTYEGVVVAVGEGRELKNGTIKPLVVKVGDQVLFEVFITTCIKLSGQEYTILKENALIMTVNDGKMKPLQDRIIVKRKEPAQVDKSGIIIPLEAQKPTYEGEVVAVGEGRELKDGSIRPLDTKVGDNIMFDIEAGLIVKFEGQDYTVLRESSVMGVLE